MRTVKEVVTNHLMQYLPDQVRNGWTETKVCDSARTAVWLDCVKNNVPATLKQIVGETLNQFWTLPGREDFPDIEINSRLTLPHDTNVTPNPLISRWAQLPISDVAKVSTQMLFEVVWVIDPELMEFQTLCLSKMDINERNKARPYRTVQEHQLIGSDPFRVLHDTIDGAERMYATSKGAVHGMWNQWDRWLLVNPVHRTTDIAAQERYLHDEFGIDRMTCEQILADKVKAFEHGFSIAAITQCISWDRIRKTGKTNIPVEKDAPASGYGHMLAMLRDPEMLKRVCSSEKFFSHPHWDLCAALIRFTPAFQKMTRSQVIKLAKFIFTPSMYGAGWGGLYRSATKKDEPNDLREPDTGDWADVPLPPLVDQLLVGKSNEFRAKALEHFCRDWSKLFKRTFPKVAQVGDHFRTRFVEEREEEGLYLDTVDGIPMLIPILRRDKTETQEFSTQVWDAEGGYVDHTVTLYKPRYDAEGTACQVQAVMRKDSGTAARGVINAQGRVMASIHDAMVFMLADEDIVQEAVRDGFNETHSHDTMRTGKKQILVPKGVRLLRPA
jgi:hypothetical protein